MCWLFYFVTHFFYKSVNCTLFACSSNDVVVYSSIKNSFKFLSVGRLNFLRSRYLLISIPLVLILTKDAISLLDILSLRYAHNFKSLGDSVG